MNIEYIEKMDEEMQNFINGEFENYALKNNIICGYNPFNLLVKENDQLVGILSGHTYYSEVHIQDLIVSEKHRRKGIGKALISWTENLFKTMDFNSMSLSTYAFQAPEFYKKCGFELEFVRVNKHNPKLTKYFFIKSF